VASFQTWTYNKICINKQCWKLYIDVVTD